jgi:chromosome segregation ATPase
MSPPSTGAVLKLHTSSELEPHEALLRDLARDREEIGARMRIINALVESRDEAREQVVAIRGLTERTMAEAEANERALQEAKATLLVREERIASLKQQLRALQTQKDERISALEQQLQEKAERLAQVEATLKMLAEADERA